MFPSWILFLAAVLYVGLLFAIATYGDRVAARRPESRRSPWIYSLALGVYCTSWTFYGAVGRAATSGWDFLPIYLGPMLSFLLGYPLIARIVEISKRHNITSIADFIGARYGRHPRLSMLVTLIALFGVLPYIALQLKAVASSFAIVSGSGQGSAPADSALATAVLLAVFAILFGTRHLSSRESHHGMVLAIAFESVCKLLAFLAVGALATWTVFDGPGDAYAAAHRLSVVRETVQEPGWQAGFLTQTLLAAAAILCLPRQFHVTVVEHTTAADLKTARWLFPLYLGLISLFVLPVMAAGLVRAPGAAPDTFVLALPQAEGQAWLTLLAFLGGFSAATSMVIVASIALATMLCNEVIMPALLRVQQLRLAEREDLSSLKIGRASCRERVS
jgi:Na+/proline symporter